MSTTLYSKLYIGFSFASNSVKGKITTAHYLNEESPQRTIVAVTVKYSPVLAPYPTCNLFRSLEKSVNLSLASECCI